MFLTAPRSFEYREAESAETPPGWVRVRMRYVGICGSDLHYDAEGRIGDQEVKYPFVLGHEGSGEVSEGAGHFESGSRVYIEPSTLAGDAREKREPGALQKSGQIWLCTYK